MGDDGSRSNDELHVYFSEALTATDWRVHPENLIVEDRPRAGRSEDNHWFETTA